MNDMNFCVWCGSKLYSGDEFCTNCGAKIEDMVEYEQTTSKIFEYESKINSLKDKYENTESKAYALIEKHFAPPQMTYYKFTNEIEESRKLFYKKVESANEIIEIVNEGIIETTSKNLKDEINDIFEKMESIIERLNDLITAFIVNLNSDSKDEQDMEELFENMDELIDSLKNYK